MKKIRVSAVSYTNTKPFIYGIEHSKIIEKIELSLDVPSQCASKLMSDQVDIGLIPIAVFPHIPHANIISNYCIAGDGPVNSVFLFSEHSIDHIQTVKLDEQSRTSNQLARVLFKYHWKKSIQFVEREADAYILIGDRSFGIKEKHAFAYDLSEEWKNFTGLPFLFAAWVANKPIDEQFKKEFDQALENGLSHRNELIRSIPVPNNFDLLDYYMNKLDFHINEQKMKAMNLFLHYLKNLDM